LEVAKEQVTAYIANYQKKKIIFQKREQELRHAIKYNISHEKIVKAAEKLREAKLNIFKSEFSRNSVLPASSYTPGEDAKRWETLTVNEIIRSYRT
jgi:hypothetical protein